MSKESLRRLVEDKNEAIYGLEAGMAEVWPVGTVVFAKFSSDQKIPVEAIVTGYDGVSERVIVKLNKNYRRYPFIREFHARIQDVETKE